MSFFRLLGLLGVAVAAFLVVTATGRAATLEQCYAERTSTTAYTGAGDYVTGCTFTADGTTAYYVELSIPAVHYIGGTAWDWILVEDGSDLGVLARLASGADHPLFAARRFTPASGSHTYKVRTTAGVFGGGSAGARQGGGAGTALSPGFLRITKANPTLGDGVDYLTEAEANALYSLLAHNHDARYCLKDGTELDADCAAGAGVTQEEFDDYVLASHTCGDPNADPPQPPCMATLTAEERENTLLGSWGIWFVAGVLLCALFADLWHRAWGFWR